MWIDHQQTNSTKSQENKQIIKGQKVGHEDQAQPGVHQGSSAGSTFKLDTYKTWRFWIGYLWPFLMEKGNFETSFDQPMPDVHWQMLSPKGFAVCTLSAWRIHLCWKCGASRWADVKWSVISNKQSRLEVGQVGESSINRGEGRFSRSSTCFQLILMDSRVNDACSLNTQHH